MARNRRRRRRRSRKTLPELPRPAEAQTELLEYTDRKPQTRKKRGRGAINVLYGEALNRKPTGFDAMYLSKDIETKKESEPFDKPAIFKRRPKTRKKRGRGAINVLYGEALNRKPKGFDAPGQIVPAGAVSYKKKNGTIGYKVRKISKKSGKAYWKYL